MLENTSTAWIWAFLFAALGMLSLFSASRANSPKTARILKVEAGSFFITALGLLLSALFLRGEIAQIVVLLLVLAWLAVSVICGLWLALAAFKEARKRKPR